MIQPGEVKAVKNYQRLNSGQLKKQLTQQRLTTRRWKVGGAHSSAANADAVNALRRRDLPFQITAMVDVEGMSDDTIQGFDDIDKAHSDKDDINDIKNYIHTRFLRNFLSPRAILLYYNTYNKDVDKEDLTQDEMYGEDQLTTDKDGSIILPHIMEFMNILGRDVED